MNTSTQITVLRKPAAPVAQPLAEELVRLANRVLHGMQYEHGYEPDENDVRLIWRAADALRRAG